MMMPEKTNPRQMKMAQFKLISDKTATLPVQSGGAVIKTTYTLAG